MWIFSSFFYRKLVRSRERSQPVGIQYSITYSTEDLAEHITAWRIIFHYETNWPNTKWYEWDRHSMQKSIRIAKWAKFTKRIKEEWCPLNPTTLMWITMYTIQLETNVKILYLYVFKTDCLKTFSNNLGQRKSFWIENIYQAKDDRTVNTTCTIQYTHPGVWESMRKGEDMSNLHNGKSFYLHFFPLAHHPLYTPPHQNLTSGNQEFFLYRR